MKNQGFALLEILVVVLMLGILVAIAIPQYQMALLKAKASQVVSLVRSLSQDQEFFYFEHRRYAKKFSDLNLQIIKVVYIGLNHVLFKRIVIILGMVGK